MTNSKNPPDLSKIQTQTLAYFAAFIALGLTTSILGPTLPDLAKNTGSTVQQISYLFIARSSGYLIGSLRGGRLFDRLKGNFLLAAVLFMMMLMLALAPVVVELWMLAGIMFLLGLSEGPLDAGTNLLLVWLHKKHANPFLNALHFFFGVGSFLGPILLAQIVLLSGDFRWAYWALALYPLPLVIWLLRLPSPQAEHQSEQKSGAQASVNLVVFLSLCFFLYVGAEIGFGNWVFSYATKLGLADQTMAAYLTSAFWGALTLGRLAGIPIATRLAPTRILYLDLVGCVISVGLLILLPGFSLVLWITAIGLGLSMASIFPTLLAFAERHMIVSGSVTRWFFVGAGAGGMVLPWLMGQIFAYLGPYSIMFAIFVDLFFALLIFIQIQRYLAKEPASSGI